MEEFLTQLTACYKPQHIESPEEYNIAQFQCTVQVGKHTALNVYSTGVVSICILKHNDE